MAHPIPSLTKLELPPVEEYRKRKVALISGRALDVSDLVPVLTMIAGITGQDGSYLSVFSCLV